jgi:NADPH-dependent 2,4-dienoyl-CoA reductase/sulfur reductase-like enzyme
VNPSAGHELERPVLGGPETRVTVPRRVLIAGGGPAGMEAARSAALRGHEVTLFELRKQLGGQINIAAKSPNRSDIVAITQWQADELLRLGVKVVLNHAVDPDVVMDIDPDVLVLATGSDPRRDGVQLARPASPLAGASLPHVYTSWDLFGYGRTPTIGRRALVYDDMGEYDALAVADELVAQGVEVTFATGFDSFGERLAVRASTAAPVLRRLAKGGVKLVIRAVLKEIRPGEVAIDVGDDPPVLDLPAAVDSLEVVEVAAARVHQFAGGRLEIHHVGRFAERLVAVDVEERLAQEVQ